jgi:hypothetical protein
MSEFPAEAGPARAGLRATRLGFRHTGLGIGVGASKPPLNPSKPQHPAVALPKSSTIEQAVDVRLHGGQHTATTDASAEPLCIHLNTGAESQTARPASTGHLESARNAKGSLPPLKGFREPLRLVDQSI